MPDEEFAALGRMVALARAVEREVYGIARACGVLDPERLGMSDALKRTRRQVRQGLPPWSRDVAPDQVLALIDECQDAFERRHRHVHWSHYQKRREGGWVAERQSLRYGTREPAEDAEPLAALMARLLTEAAGTFERLLLEVRPGVCVWHPQLQPLDGPGAIVLYDSVTQTWPDERPTEEELDAWYENLKATAPAEWATWPAERHAAQ